MSCSKVLGIPTEITEHALSFCHPTDVAAFSQTCRCAYTIIYHSGDHHLWRNLFLLLFDDPRSSIRARNNPEFGDSFDWKHELQRRIEAERIAFSDNRSLEFEKAQETFISMVETASSIQQEGPLYEPSRNHEWLTRVLKDSGIMIEPVGSSQSRDSELRSQINSYIGLSLAGYGDSPELLPRGKRAESRCFVYDLRKYIPENKYGPYSGDLVHWRHVESIVNVVMMNIRELPSLWANTKPPTGLEATRAYSAPGTLAKANKDWAGVEGTWDRYVCFMDYRDLFTFNYSTVSHGPRHPSFFDGGFQEATRLIQIKLEIIPLAKVKDPKRVCAFHDHKATPYPPIHFQGTSKGANGNEATVEGSVYLGIDGIPRWQFASIHNGNTQWSSEGVQIGNIASASGLVGTWTGAHHEQGDPVGPFWMWKVVDEPLKEFQLFDDD